MYQPGCAVYIMLGVMNNRRALLAVAVGNGLAALLAGLWGYTSYMYNWLNIGGGIGDVTFLDSMREAVPHVALVAWLGLLVGVATFRRELSPDVRSQLVFGIVSLMAGPTVLFLSDWYFHIGFPKAPV
jgi:hypothetical protein